MTPAEYVTAAPSRIVDWLAREGFTVELSITRAETATISPESILPDVDDSLTDEDKANIAGHLAAYDATEPYDGSAPESEEPPAETASN